MFIYFLNVDLGDLQDSTAISLLQRREMFQEYRTLPGTEARAREPRRIVSRYDLRLLERPPLGTGYPEINRRIGTIMEAPELVGRTALVVDATGVGLPVIQFMREDGLAPIPIILTSGGVVNENSKIGGYNVPKREVVTALQIVYQSGRIKIASKLELAATFRKELERFKIKYTKRGTDTYEAWREQDHDDIVLSVGIGTWYAEKLYGIYRQERKPKQRDYDPLWHGLREPD